MANFDDSTQRKTGFFHALGYILTKDVNDPANEKYKSAHNVSSSEIWTDTINYSIDFSAAETEAVTNAAVTQVGNEGTIPTTLALLYPLKDSNGQAWFLDTGSPTWDTTGFIPSSGWVKPLISPVDVTNASGEPSFGFSFRLYTPAGSLISTLNGKWELDYYGSILKFNVGSTPFDSGNGLGFVTDFSSLVTAPDKTVYLQSNGPRAVAFQYSGEYLSDALTNLPSSDGSGDGSNEWKDSVKSYMISVGTGSVVNGATSTNGQLNYLISNYESFYIKTNTVTANTYSVSDDTFYQYVSGSFITHSPVTTDDNNRYLQIENSITLDTVSIVGTGSSYSLTLNDTVLKDRIIEFLGTSSTGLSQSGWQVTNPRVGMVTTLDDLKNRRTRYTGPSNGWVELYDEVTFKVNSQKGITCGLTEVDYDVAVDEIVKYEPSGDRSIDVLINGVEVFNDGYTFAQPSVYTTITGVVSGTNSVDIPVVQAPTASQYLRFDTGLDYNYRKISSITSSGGTATVIYSGYDVPAFSSLDKFSVTYRANNRAAENDLLLWKGSTYYELDNEDCLTLEYVTINSNAQED